jgi:hypothetical protein
MIESRIDLGSIEPELKLIVTPEPTDHEAAAIAAALSVVLLSQSSRSPEPAISETQSKWLVAGRREAISGLAKRSHLGWGRRR